MTIEIVEKVCTVCKTLKSLDKFGLQKRKIDGREAQCLECVNTYRRERRKQDKTPGKTRTFHLWTRYKMRPEEYEALLKSQNGVCAICANPPKGKEKHLRVDHCHSTNAIRGLLCAACNIGLGVFGDSVEGLEKAIAYLHKVENELPIQPAKIPKPHTQGKAHHWYGKTSLVPRGEDSPRAILTDAKVLKILSDWDTGNITQGELSKEHGVSTATIQKVIQRQLWKHVVYESQKNIKTDTKGTVI